MKAVYVLIPLLFFIGCVSTTETTTSIVTTTEQTTTTISETTATTTTTIATTVTTTNESTGTTSPTTTTETTIIDYIDLSPAESKNLIETEDVIIIDVSPNYADGHLPGSVNYYIGDGSLDAAITKIDKNAIYLVYCHVDSASILGAQTLIDNGFINVYRLEGNYAAWVAAGYDVEV